VGDNSESLKQQTTAAPSSSIYSTSNVDNDIYDNLYNIYFDQTAIEMAKLFADSTLQVMQEQGQEVNINWLASELDTISNEKLSWKVNNHQENELNIELSSSHIKYVNSTYIIIDDLNRTSQRCSHSVSKPLKQLGGIWELDFETVNEILRSNENGIHSLEICSNHFNYDNKQLHSCQKSEGGHLYEQRRRGAVLLFDCTDQHCDDSIKSLQFLAKWINDISESAERNTQCLLLDKIFRKVIAFFEKSKLAKLNKEENVNDEELESDMIRNDENE
ncbi:36093_t:CDS:2, partial [Racocetra persica]